MDAKEKVLATMKEAGQPLNAGKIAELSGLDRKEVDAAMKQLKAGLKIDTTPLITHRFPLERIAEAYELFEQKRDGVIKVAITQ